METCSNYLIPVCERSIVKLIIHNLHSNKQETLASEVGITERRLEDYIVYALLDHDDVDYMNHAELLYDLAGQMVRHLLSYLSEDEARDVLERQRRLIAENIHAQMMDHFWEKSSGYEVKVSWGFTALRPCNYTASAQHPVTNFRETVTDKGRIKQMLFGRFGTSHGDWWILSVFHAGLISHQEPIFRR